ncbi:MAG: hypothetical protein DRJ01_19200 [Bacteroidetes bacterium]|nr:MAG: hypothetical protein DRJ01_19200 [Bacteroidota bacterium]
MKNREAYIGSTTFMSCEKNEKTINELSILDNKEAIHIGEAHNKSLNALYNDFKNLKLNKSTLNENDYINYTIESSKNYLIKNEGLLKSEVEDIYNQIGISNYAYKSTKSDSDIIEISELINNVEDDIFKSLLQDIMKILETDLGSYEALDNALKEVKYKAVNTKYLAEITSITSVSRNSYLYWEENYDEWIALFSDGNKSVNIDSRFWDIMEADAQGAAGGAICGGLGAPVASGISGIFIAIRAAK